MNGISFIDLNGTQIFLDFVNQEFNCPFCGEQHHDFLDIYLKRCNKNKSGITRVKCNYCGKYFKMSYDQTGDAISFL